MATDTNITTHSRWSLIAAGMVSALGIGATGARAAPTVNPALAAAIEMHKRAAAVVEIATAKLNEAERVWQARLRAMPCQPGDAESRAAIYRETGARAASDAQMEAMDVEYDAREVVAHAPCETPADICHKLAYLAGHEFWGWGKPDGSENYGSLLVAIAHDLAGAIDCK